ncbi:MAG: hypothetical protein COB36_11570 [Alphaproteobacteria bacterium]|nr:MAG: hypothetical protein COB36_11570 [Alphaproteobacteria bacterium]
MSTNVATLQPTTKPTGNIEYIVQMLESIANQSEETANRVGFFTRELIGATCDILEDNAKPALPPEPEATVTNSMKRLCMKIENNLNAIENDAHRLNKSIGQ